MSLSPLCKISFFVNQQNNQPSPANGLTKNYIEVMPGMTTYEIALKVGELVGYGYQQFIEIEIKNQLMNMLECDGKEVETVWRRQMQKILESFCHTAKSHKQQNQSYEYELNSELSQKRNTSRYFQISYDKFFKNQSEKRIPLHHKQNDLNIYERSMMMKKRTQEKLSKIKKNQLNSEISQCTFAPNINDTLEFFNKKNPKFFNESEQEKQERENRFQKLYKQSIDLREKKKQRLRTLQNEEESKLSELSFIPHINECSRQICKMKSYSSFISEINQMQEKQQAKTKAITKEKQKEGTAKKSKFLCTFHPQLSENTKKLTQNLPSFYQRLELEKDKKCVKQSKSSINLKERKIPKNHHQQANRIKVKKQIYTIDDSFSDKQNQKPTQKKLKSKQKGNKYGIINVSQFTHNSKAELQETSQLSISSSFQNQTLNRSHELFNIRKKVIFETIFKFLSLKPQISIGEFAHKKLANKEIKDIEISIEDIMESPYLPIFIKELFSPIAIELGELEITLNKDQFVWSLEKLFEGLSLGDRGSLLGWGIKLLPQQSD